MTREHQLRTAQVYYTQNCKPLLTEVTNYSHHFIAIHQFVSLLATGVALKYIQTKALAIDGHDAFG
jgi:hypothetical protein